MITFFMRSLALASVVVASAAESSTELVNHTSPGSQVKVEVRQFHMGMIVRMTAWAPTQDAGLQACRAAFERIGVLDREVFSDYQRDSELRRLSRAEPGRPIPLSPPLFTVLQAACRLAAQTNGRYDPTAKPIIDLWRQARRDGRPPTPDQIREARSRVGYQHVLLNPDPPSVNLASHGIELDVGSIAKGYIADAALAVMREHGSPIAMVEAGGDMVLGDPPPGRTGWPVSPPNHPPPPMMLAQCAISTSGDTSQFLEFDGVRYSHVIDARTGQALTHQQGCVVIAPSAMLSDALATVGTLLDPDDFQTLLHESYPGTQAWLLSPNDSPTHNPSKNPFESTP